MGHQPPCLADQVDCQGLVHHPQGLPQVRHEPQGATQAALMVTTPAMTLALMVTAHTMSCRGSRRCPIEYRQQCRHLCRQQHLQDGSCAHGSNKLSSLCPCCQAAASREACCPGSSDCTMLRAGAWMLSVCQASGNSQWSATLAPHNTQADTVPSMARMHTEDRSHVPAAHLNIRVESRQQLGAPQLLRTSHTLLQMLDFLQNKVSCWRSTSRADE